MCLCAHMGGVQSRAVVGRKSTTYLLHAFGLHGCGSVMCPLQGLECFGRVAPKKSTLHKKNVTIYNIKFFFLNDTHEIYYNYSCRSESMASVYSQGEGRYGTVAVRGDVEFGFIYNFGSGSLDISIRQCRDLAPVDLKRNRSDP